MADLDAELALFESEIAALEGEGDTAQAADSEVEKVPAAAVDQGPGKGAEKEAPATTAAAGGQKRARVEYASAPVKHSVTHGFDPSVGAYEESKEEIAEREFLKREADRFTKPGQKQDGSDTNDSAQAGQDNYGGQRSSGAATSQGGGMHGDQGGANSFQAAFMPPPLPVPAPMHNMHGAPLNAPKTAAPLGPPAGPPPGVPDKVMRTAGGKKWEDNSLAEWPADDYRMFCGNLGNEVDDSTLARTFGKYPSFQKAKIVRDGRTKKPKGYGFVSFADPADFTKALKECQGKYVGNRPVKLKKSEHEQRMLAPGKVKEKKPQDAEEVKPWWEGGNRGHKKRKVGARNFGKN